MTRPCVKCGGLERYASGNCIACARARANRFYAEKSQAVRARVTQRYRDNADRLREYAAEYRAKNPEKVKSAINSAKEKNATYYNELKARRRVEHPDRVRAERLRWREQNPHGEAKLSSRKRATKLKATPAWANEFFISEAYHLAKLREKVCGGKWHVDHIVPLRSKFVCGLHVENNLQVIPESVNLAKGNRHWPDQP